MDQCEHGVPATLSTDIDYLREYGVNPDCIHCPSVYWCDECRVHYVPGTHTHDYALSLALSIEN